MRLCYSSLALLGLLSLALLHPVQAQVIAPPALMNFQGRLAKPDGTPVPNGNYSIRFSLWTAVTGGTETWNQTLNPVAVKNGTFAVFLNTSTGAADKFNGDLWLEIKIGTDAPLTPRQQLVSVPYALKANTVPDGSLTADKFATGALNTLSWLLGGNSGTNPASQFLGTTDDQPLVFRTNNGERMRLNSTGLQVSGGITTGTIDAGIIITGRIIANGDVTAANIFAGRIIANGDISAFGVMYANAFIQNSDERYKQHIATFPDALDAILSLRGVTFDWNQDAWKERNFPAGTQIGFIAQEVEKVLPQLVSTDSNGYKSVAYANVVPVLVEAVKQQQKQRQADKAEIAELKQDNATIKAENAELKARLEALEVAVQRLTAQPK